MAFRDFVYTKYSGFYPFLFFLKLTWLISSSVSPAPRIGLDTQCCTYQTYLKRTTVCYHWAYSRQTLYTTAKKECEIGLEKWQHHWVSIWFTKTISLQEVISFDEIWYLCVWEATLVKNAVFFSFLSSTNPNTVLYKGWSSNESLLKEITSHS